MTTLQTLRNQAANANAHLPQYKGMFDTPDWTIMTLKRDIKTKMGVAGVKGQQVMARRDPHADLTPELKNCIQFWSQSNKCLTLVPASRFEA